MKFLRKIIHILKLLLGRIRVYMYTLIFRFKLKFYGFNCGKRLKIDGKVYIKCNDNSVLKIGDNFTLNSRFGSNLVGITNHAIFQLINNGKIVIGNNCGFSATVFSARKEIYIGNNVMIGGNVRIFDHDYHSLNYEDRRNSLVDGQNTKSASIKIGDDVFIGTNAIILKGVTIGDRSVIGAGAVVSIKTIPEDSLVIGNPAKIIKYEKA